MTDPALRCDWCERRLTEKQASEWRRKAAKRTYRLPKKFCSIQCKGYAQHSPGTDPGKMDTKW